MDLEKFNPWNWFKKEEEQDRHGTCPRTPAPQAPPQRTEPLASLHQEIDRLFEHAFDGFNFEFPKFAKAAEGSFRPKVDIAGSEKEYTIAAELPGVDQKDIHIDLSGDELTISAESRREKKSEDKGFYSMERSCGSFRRVLTLPEDADVKGVHATSKDGVVTITIPRVPGVKAAAKHIPIE